MHHQIGVFQSANYLTTPKELETHPVANSDIERKVPYVQTLLRVKIHWVFLGLAEAGERLFNGKPIA